MNGVNVSNQSQKLVIAIAQFRDSRSLAVHNNDYGYHHIAYSFNRTAYTYGKAVAEWNEQSTKTR